MMKFLEQTWRWYGPEDPVRLSDVKQAGATGVVTALHHMPHGEVWSVDEILKRKKIIEDNGLIWSVVESVPVHEDIKTRTGNCKQLVANYCQTLDNLASCGITTICYNFMPVLDWTRTKLDLEMKNGAKALYFDWIDLALFDLHILKRENAVGDYSTEILQKVEKKISSINPKSLNDLASVVLMGIPNEGNISLETLRKSIDKYQRIGREGLKENHIWFLRQIGEVCRKNSINMTIHPDDPPYPILGLPRIASTEEDFKFIITEVNEDYNGVCFCTGSLGAGQDNDLISILHTVKHRVHFAHLRNVKKDDIGSFYESDHLDGDVNMYAIVKILAEENQQRVKPIPFRPDHGHQMLDDLGKVSNPGYSAIGRLRGLAELRGLEMGILGTK